MMRILVTGIYGFIASQITGTLRAAGHTIIGCVRDVAKAKKRFPDLEMIECDFRKDTDPYIWLPRIQPVDAIVNCVGVLQSSKPEEIEAIHFKTPHALFEACQIAHKRIIHFSALGADAGVDTLYAKTKYALEKYVSTLDGDWIILRPSMVYGTGSYGGTSLFRALAAIPWIIPVVGKGSQEFQPIHIRDIAKTVLTLLEKKEITKKTINVVGPEKITLEQLLVTLRQWLGFNGAKIIHIPLSIMKPFAKLGDWFSDIPINSTSFKMLSYSNTADPKPFIETLGFNPVSIDKSLLENPSSTQDRWHARIYFLNPLLRIALGLLWLLSGILPLLVAQEVLSILTKVGFSTIWAELLFYASCGIDILLGFATLFNYRLKWTGSIQLILIIFYTLFISIFLPEYWLDPFGSIVKNIPILVATLFMMALSDPR